MPRSIIMHVLLLTILATATLTVAMKKECLPCSGKKDCLSDFCFGGTCIIKNSRASFEKCLLPECASCKSKSDCSTKFCFRGRCIFRDASSFEKCFINTDVSPSPRPVVPPTMKLLECARCSSAEDCEQKSCSGVPRVCNANTLKSRKACFRPECAKCQIDAQCASRTCSEGRCVFRSAASLARCAIGLKDECKRCKMAEECRDDKCDGKPRKCNKGNDKSVKRCFRRDECADCDRGHECRQGSCQNGRCTDGTPGSLIRCGLRPSLSSTPSPSPEPRKETCESCKRFSECKARQCKEGKCGSTTRVAKCKKRECESCTTSSQCEGVRLVCFRSKCTTNRLDSLMKCGFKSICAACSTDQDCSDGLCTAGLCIEGSTDGYDGLLQCGRRRECDTCDSSEQCATRRCSGRICRYLLGSTRKNTC